MMHFGLYLTSFYSARRLHWFLSKLNDILMCCSQDARSKNYVDRNVAMMKQIIIAVVCLIPLFTIAENNEYNISSFQEKGSRAPNTYLAIYGNATPTVWTEVVSQEYYDDVASTLAQ